VSFSIDWAAARRRTGDLTSSLCQQRESGHRFPYQMCLVDYCHVLRIDQPHGLGVSHRCGGLSHQIWNHRLRRTALPRRAPIPRDGDVQLRVVDVDYENLDLVPGATSGADFGVTWWISTLSLTLYRGNDFESRGSYNSRGGVYFAVSGFAWQLAFAVVAFVVAA